MVKRREHKPTEADIEAFAAGADGGGESTTDTAPDSRAKRDFKSLRVPFNEYEWKRLDALVEATGRSKLNAIRWAVLQMAESEAPK
jgi:hypothetical protein